MPTVRKLNRTVGTQGLPGARLTASETPDSLGAGVQRAKADAAGTLAHVAGGLGKQFGSYSNDELERTRAAADDVKELEWTRAVDNYKLTRLHDTENGVLNMQGKAVFEMPEKVDDEFRELADGIDAGLNDRQRGRFQAFRQQQGNEISLVVRRKVAGEMRTYEAEELKATLGNKVSLAAAHALDGPLLVRDIQAGEDAIIRAATRNGIGPEVYEGQLEAFRTAAHTGVIDNLLAAGEERKAEIYLEEKTSEIAGDARDELVKKVESGTTAKKARTASDGIWKELGPKNDAQPIDLEQMEDKARELFPEDDKSLKAAMLNLRERKAAADASRADRKEERAGALWSSVAKGATLAQIQSMPEYRSAPGQLQAQISEHVVQEQEQAANRAYTRGQRGLAAIGLAENKKERDGWAEMWRIENPAVLSTMTDNQILELTPKLGVDHVNRLMTKRRALTASEETVRAATIDADLFKTTAAADGMNAYSPKSEDEKAALGQLQNAVETVIDQEQRATGKILTRERKQQIQRSIQDQKVMLDRWGGMSTEAQIAATVTNPKDRAKAYVPLEKFPPAALGGYTNYLRSVSVAARKMSDGQIAAAFKDRIQKAYGRRMLGGTRAELENILQGGED